MPTFRSWASPCWLRFSRSRICLNSWEVRRPWVLRGVSTRDGVRLRLFVCQNLGTATIAYHRPSPSGYLFATDFAHDFGFLFDETTFAAFEALHLFLSSTSILGRMARPEHHPRLLLASLDLELQVDPAAKALGVKNEWIPRRFFQVSWRRIRLGRDFGKNLDDRIPNLITDQLEVITHVVDELRPLLRQVPI